MSNPEDFNTMVLLVIDNSNELFKPGQTITGRVYCTLQHATSIEVKVRLVGEECTYHNEPAYSSSTTDDQCWKKNFLGPEDATVGLGYFKTGEHKFPFKLVLPTFIPSSYKGMYGHVKYFVTAYVTYNSGETENKDEIELKVFCPINLNDVADLPLVPRTYSRELALNRWFCITEVVQMDVRLEKNAFILGETINVNVEIENNTFMSVSAVLLELSNKVEAKVPPPKPRLLTVNEQMAHDLGGGIGGNKTRKYMFHLKIPEDAEYPNFQNCTLLSQKGLLKVIAILSSSAKLAVEIELVLGHYSQDERKDSGKIRPPAYGIMIRPSTEISESDIPSLLTRIPVLYPPSQYSSRSFIEDAHVGPNLVPPYPIDSKSEQVNGENLIVPVPKAKTSTPYPVKEPNLPYPTSNSCPYPKEDNFSPLPYPTVDTCPYPREDSTKSLPYPKEESKGLPYPKEVNFSSPYPTESICPYPKEKVKKSLPYLPVAKLPYPIEKSTDTRLFNVSRSSGKSCPYPTETKFEPNPPYPKEIGNFQEYNKTNATSSSFRSSFDEKILPYPREDEEKAPLLHKSSTDASESPKKMPMPSYPNNTQPPYPISKPSFDTSETAKIPPPIFDKVAPYPIEQPLHSTLGFAEFTPMPMPSAQSSITCGPIGFAVPTSKSMNAFSSIEPLEQEDQPSAPLLSDMKTPPIARLDELEDLPFIDADDEATGIEGGEQMRSRQSSDADSSRLDLVPPSAEQTLQSPQKQKKKKRKDRPKRELLLAS